MNRWLCSFVALVFFVLVLAPAWAGGPVMPRQAVKGTLIVVSNLERADYEDFIAKLRPKYVIWVTPQTPRDSITMPPAGLAMVLFLLRSQPEGIRLDPSWTPDLPVPAGQLTYPATMIAATTIHPPGKPKPKPPWYVTMVIMAPNDKLMSVTLKEAVVLRDFPLAKPVRHEVIDLRELKAIACLPSVAGSYLGPLGSAAEAALYRALIDLRSFRVVGREALPIASAPAVMTIEQVRRIGQQLRVQALAFAELSEAESQCEEEIRYRTRHRSGVSAERQREFDELKERYDREGKTLKQKRPTADLTWAAPYRHREYTTSVAGLVKVVDVATGQPILTYPIDDSVSSEEEDEVRSFDYRWHYKDDVRRGSRSTDTYLCPLRTMDAIEICRSEVTSFGAFLGARAMLPIPGKDFVAEYPPVAGVDVVARVLSADGTDVFIDYGRERLAREEDTFSFWADKDLQDPDTGEVIETIKTRAIRLRVMDVYQKTSRCEIVQQSEEHALQVGMTLVLD